MAQACWTEQAQAEVEAPGEVGHRPAGEEAVGGSRLELQLAGEVEEEVARWRMAVARAVRAERSMTVVEVAAVRSSRAQAALVEHWMLVMAVVLRFLMANLEAVARMEVVKVVVPQQAFWEAEVAAAQKEGRSILAPEEEEAQGYGLQAVAGHFFGQ